MQAGAVAWTHRTQKGVQRGATVGGRLVLAITPRLQAFVAKTGETAWTQDVGGLVRELAVSNGMLYAVVQDTQSIAGTSSLMAFDPFTGRRIWRFDLGPENPRRLRGWRDRVLLEKTRWDARQSVARLMIFDAFLGTLQHQVPIPIQTEAAPIVAGDVFVLAHRKHVKQAFQRQLKAYDLVRGVERWRTTMAGDIGVTGLSSDGDRVVVLQGDGHIRTYRSEDGEQIAVTKIAVAPRAYVQPFMHSPVLLDETSITFLPAVRPPTARASSTPALMSFDRVTGKVRWASPFPKGADLTAARLAVYGDTLIAVVAYRKGRSPHILIRLVDRRTGALIQDIEPDGLAQPRWVPTSQTGQGTLVVFGRSGASIWRGAPADKR
jgi:outer membrane protein assembly factor BamB